MPPRPAPSLARLGAALLVAACALGGSAGVTAAYAQSAENVAVVINDNSPVSQRIGEYYAQRRAVPAGNIIRIRAAATESIEREAFSAAIEEPIAEAIRERSLHDRVLYLVLTKGVPLRITGSGGPNGTGASVDSELTLLYRRLVGPPPPASGRVDNPYFLRDAPPSAYTPFTHREHDIYLVTRLDGFTEQDVLALIDRGLAPATTGRVVLDGRDPLLDRTAEGWLAAAAARLEASGPDRVLLDTTPQPVRNVAPVLGYYSWGSMDAQNRVRKVGLTFAPGAIAADFVPTGARTFEAPAPAWAPTPDPRGLQTADGHTLIGDLIAEGITGVAGHIAEPYMQGMVRPDALFPAYFAGANLAEAFYLALPYLSWQTVVIGDPLTAPFRTITLTQAEIADPVDPEMQLPMIFARRVVTRSKEALPGLTDRAAVLGVRANVLLSRGDTEAGRAALEEAVKLEPRATAWLLQLAGLDETAQRYDEAIARYRQLLAQQPNHVIALNNLAYALAVHRKSPKEAHPIAKRAATLSPNQPLIADTLGWIEHLLGNHAEALRVLTAAAAAAPEHAEIQLHLAVVQAQLGAHAEAERALGEALRLDPTLADRQDARDLRARLSR